jgi:hypothetical protein
MSKLSEKEFAHIVRTAPEGASEDDVMEAARRLEASQPKERKGLLARVWEWVNKPTIDLPDIDLSTNTGIVGVDAMSRVPGLAGSLVEGLSSPIGLASAVLSGGASLAGRAGLLGISRGARIAEAALSAPYAATGAYHAAEGIREGDLGKAAAGAIEGGLGAYGARSAMTHAFPVDKVAKAYAKKAGIQQPEPQFAEKWDQGFASRVADAYDEMPHAPNDPRVKSAYDAMGREVSDQFEFVTQQAGVKMEPWTQPGQPYANSAEMMADVRKNNRLYYFPSEAGYGQGQAQAIGEFPLLQPGRSGQPVNDEFRAIHDYFGHARRGHQFGPLGEENAYREHASLFSNEAIPALTTETRGQNSWVNAGKHLRRPDGSLPKRGDPDFIKPQDRPFAEQKAGILPKQFQGDPALDSVLNSGQPYGILSAANPGTKLDEATNAARHQEMMQDLRSLGYNPVEQKGVYGGAPEPSFLVPGMTPEHAKLLGSKYGQEAVISAQGWHRLADDATFPRTSQVFDQGRTDYYSEVNLPQGQTTKYSLDFPPEAYDAPRTSAVPTGRVGAGQMGESSPPATPFEGYSEASGARTEAPSLPAAAGPSAGNTRGPVETTSAQASSASSFNGSTALAVASPAAAMGVPDDPESNWDEALRIGLAGAGVAGLGMAARRFSPRLQKQIDDYHDQVVAGMKARGIEKPMESHASQVQTLVRKFIRSKGKTPGEGEDLIHGYETIALPVHKDVDFDQKKPIGALLKKGKSGGVELSDWSNRRMELAYEEGNVPDMWGDSRWLYHATNGDPEAAVVFTRLLGTFSPGQKTHANTVNAVEAFIRSMQGEETESILASLSHGHPRPQVLPDNMNRAIQGGRIFQEKAESLAGAELGIHDRIPIDMWLLRALGANTDTTPAKNTYKLIAEGIARAAEKRNESPFAYMAKVWMGMQKIAGAPTPSFSESLASMRLPGHLTDSTVQRQVQDNIYEHIDRAFSYAGGPEPRDMGKAKDGRVKQWYPDQSLSPIATNPRLGYEQWLETVQANFRAGIDRGDVLGKVQQPLKERPMTLEQLKAKERKRRSG